MAANIQDSSVACGVNSAEDVLLTGRNENCRVFSAKDNNDLEDYPAFYIYFLQKVTVISPGGSLVAVAGANTFHLLSYPSLVPVASSISTEDEIYDVTFSETTVVVVTVASLLVYALPSAVDQTSSSPSKKKKKKKTASVSKVVPELELLRTVEIPDAVGGPGGGKFRSAKQVVLVKFRNPDLLVNRYHPTDSRVLYTAINSSPVRTRKSKTASRKAFLCKWNTDSWTVEQVRKVGERGLTCFTVRSNGGAPGIPNTESGSHYPQSPRISTDDSRFQSNFWNSGVGKR
ncbi:hypothetical protein C8J56DRAFT_887644 [Mycena floridula]|nr:hypothetical protein C8J56DRAFT_887644 [Mycena floridula]